MKHKKNLLKVIKKRKWIIIPAVVILAAGIGGSIFLVSRNRGMKAMAGAMAAQSVQVTKGNITTTVVGTGNLESASAENVYLPKGIEVEEVLVDSGEHVEEGAVLAKLDAASITNKMLSIQEEIDDLDEEINEVKDDTESEIVTTKISGRVKKIYAEEGTTVADTMAKYGALILLSVDGKMAVELKNVNSVSKGDTVTVILSDGETRKEGTVASLDGSVCIVTLTDKGTTLGELVAVTDEKDKSLGNGVLYIHQQLEITAVGGTTEDIEVSENEAVSADETLLTLADVPASGKYQELIAKREKLAEQLKSLMELSRTGTLTAEFSGTVQSVNVTENSTVGSSSASSSSGTTGNSQGAVIGTKTASVSGSSSQAAFLNLSTSVMKSSRTLIPASATEGATEEKSKAAAKTTIASISNLLTVPFPGSSAQSAVQTEQCSGTVEWFTGGAAFSGDFASGTSYTAKAALTAADGFAFATDNSMVITQDGSSNIEWNVTEEKAEITITFPPTEITDCSISMTTPKAGEAPQTVINSTSTYTGTVSWSPQAAVFQENTQYIATVTLQAAGDYRFASADRVAVSLNGGAVSQVSVSSDQKVLTMLLVYQIDADGKAGTTDSETQGTQAQAGNTQQTNGGQQTNGQQQSGEKQNSTEANSEKASTGAGGTAASGGSSAGGVSAGGSVSGSSGSSTASSDSAAGSGSSSGETEESDSSKVTAFTVSPEENMTLSVSVDELDILSIALDQKASITFDAIEGETFEGTIASISDTASVNGGVAKYTVEITLPKNENMRVGMNASATITVEDKQDILLIPVSALQERGKSVFVYTEEDSESGSLSGEAEVETGLSDGSNVEILSGLSEGDTVYYIRSASTDSSSDSEKGGMLDRGMGGGNMNFDGGERPSGGPSGGGGMPSGSSGRQ